MRVHTDEEMIARGGRLGQLATFIGLVMVFGALVASFTEYRLMAIVLIALGVVMYTLGSRGQQQSIRGPRTISQLVDALSEFDDRYRLYNHMLPADHVLLTPHAVFVLAGRSMEGRIRCFKDKWVRDLTLSRLLRFFTEESLGNPSKEAQQDVNKLEKYIQEHAPEVAPEVQAVVVFTNPAARLEVTSSSVPVLPLRKLKSHVRKSAGRTELTPEELRALTELFESPPRS